MPGKERKIDRAIEGEREHFRVKILFCLNEIDNEIELIIYRFLSLLTLENDTDIPCQFIEQSQYR